MMFHSSCSKNAFCSVILYAILIEINAWAKYRNEMIHYCLMTMIPFGIVIKIYSIDILKIMLEKLEQNYMKLIAENT